eukprot:PhF_6_TR21173/c0_g1_i2/m.30516
MTTLVELQCEVEAWRSWINQQPPTYSAAALKAVALKSSILRAALMIKSGKQHKVVATGVTPLLAFANRVDEATQTNPVSFSAGSAGGSNDSATSMVHLSTQLQQGLSNASTKAKANQMELYDTEITYVTRLYALQEILQGMELAPIPPSFQNALGSVLECHKRIVRQMQVVDIKESSNADRDFCKAIETHVDEMRGCYGLFVAVVPTVRAYMQKCRTENEDFRNLLTAQENAVASTVRVCESMASKDMSFDGLLMCPIQRLHQYPTLLKNHNKTELCDLFTMKVLGPCEMALLDAEDVPEIESLWGPIPQHIWDPDNDSVDLSGVVWCNGTKMAAVHVGQGFVMACWSHKAPTRYVIDDCTVFEEDTDPASQKPRVRMHQGQGDGAAHPQHLSLTFCDETKRKQWIEALRHAAASTAMVVDSHEEITFHPSPTSPLSPRGKTEMNNDGSSSPFSAETKQQEEIPDASSPTNDKDQVSSNENTDQQPVDSKPKDTAEVDEKEVAKVKEKNEKEEKEAAKAKEKEEKEAAKAKEKKEKEEKEAAKAKEKEAAKA